MKVEDLKRLLRSKLTPQIIFEILFALVAAYRVWACMQNPMETTDIYRYLGYGKHAFDHFFGIYEYTPRQISPTEWATIWPDQKFAYPPYALYFFSFFSFLHLGIFWVKLTMTALEGIMGYWVSQNVNRWVGLALWASPISIWYTSFEGQYEGFQSFLIFLCVIQIQKKNWDWGGFWFLTASLTKVFGFLLLPWILSEISQAPKRETKKILSRFIFGVGASFFCVQMYIWRSGFTVIKNILGGNGLVYNPFWWTAGDYVGWNPKWLVIWNLIFSYGFILLAFLSIYLKKKSRMNSAFDWSPLLSFWILLKSMRWAQFWYPVAVPAFFLIQRTRWVVVTLVVLHFLQSGRAIDMLYSFPKGTNGSTGSMPKLAHCLYFCDIEKPN